MPRGRVDVLDGRSRSPGFRASSPRLPRPFGPVARAAGSACGEALARSQWRVRAGLAPASLGHRPLMCSRSYRCGPTGSLRVTMTVNLTRIYTKLGDGGETHLGDMSRVPKTHPRIEAYGAVDELNAHLGVTLTLPDLPEQQRGWLHRIQNELFDVGADLAVPHGGERERLRVDASYTDVPGGALRRGQRDARAPEVVRHPRRDAGRRAPARLPHGLPPRRAPGDPRRGRQPGGRPLPQPASATCCSSSAAAANGDESRSGSRALRARRRARAAAEADRHHAAISAARPAMASAPTTNVVWPAA